LSTTKDAWAFTPNLSKTVACEWGEAVEWGAATVQRMKQEAFEWLLWPVVFSFADEGLQVPFGSFEAAAQRGGRRCMVHTTLWPD